MYGLLRGLPLHNNPEVREYIRRWLHFHLSEGVHVHYFCGSWSFALLYPEVAKQFPEVSLQLTDTAEKIYDVIMHKALRNGEGIILHNVDLPNIYIDTVYYSAVLLAKLGPFLGKDWETEAGKQLDSHLEILRDMNGKFYIHCQENLSGKRSEGSWARGNGWVMMTYAELLSVLPNGLETYGRLSAAFKKLTDDLLAYQAPSGLWKTIIDEPKTYDEISASAMYLFAMQKGRSLGVLGNEYDAAIRKIVEGIKANIDSEHRVLGVSEGTWPGTKEYYLSLSCGEWWWGTGAALLALAEL
jgi:unsaturated rhamnogalacturonyl hydrolase